MIKCKYLLLIFLLLVFSGQSKILKQVSILSSVSRIRGNHEWTDNLIRQKRQFTVGSGLMIASTFGPAVDSWGSEDLTFGSAGWKTKIITIQWTVHIT